MAQVFDVRASKLYRVPGTEDSYNSVIVRWLTADGTFQEKTFASGTSPEEDAKAWAAQNVPDLSTSGYRLTTQTGFFGGNESKTQFGFEKANPKTGKWEVVKGVAVASQQEAIQVASSRFGATLVAPSEAIGSSANAAESRLPQAPPVLLGPDLPPATPKAGAPQSSGGLPSVDTAAQWLLDGRPEMADNAAKAKAGDPTALAVQNRALEIATERGFFGTPQPPPTGGAPTGETPTGGAPLAGMPEAPIQIDPTKLDSDEMYNLVKAGYGWAAMYLKDIELGPLIRRAAAEGWGQNEIDGAIQNTRWYQNTGTTARNWDISKAKDPATQATLVQRRLAEINTGAMALGLNITGVVDLGEFGRYNKAYYMAVQSLREGWTDQMLKTAVIEEGGFDPTKAQRAGVLKQQAYALKKQAAEYMLPMSDETANRYAGEMLTGKMTEDTFVAILTDQAKMRFPTLAALIDRGATPWKFFDSYRSVIADTLEMDDNQVDFMSPQFSEVLDYVDPASGQTRFMTLTEARTWAKNRSGWDFTQQAADAAQRASKALFWSFDTPAGGSSTKSISPAYSQPWQT